MNIIIIIINLCDRRDNNFLLLFIINKKTSFFIKYFIIIIKYHFAEEERSGYKDSMHTEQHRRRILPIFTAHTRFMGKTYRRLKLKQAIFVGQAPGLMVRRSPLSAEVEKDSRCFVD